MAEYFLQFLRSNLRLIVLIVIIFIYFYFKNRQNICAFQGCSKRFTDREGDQLSINNKKYCRSHALTMFFGALANYTQPFLFFKPYPLGKMTDEETAIDYIDMAKNTVNSLDKDVWGKEEQERKTVYQRFEMFSRNIGGICQQCGDKKATLGYFENNELDYANFVSLQKVTTAAKNICVTCLERNISPILSDRTTFPKLLFRFPKTSTNPIIFYLAQT